MKTILAFLIIAGSLISVARAAEKPQVLRPVHTYSIVCYDSATGQFGAAVQSHWFKVANVIWAEPGVGAVATQSFADFRYGPLGLHLMSTGKTAEQALAGVLASDPEERVRQVAMIDKTGAAATHTGEDCIYAAGDRQGKFYSAQANLMRNETVWDAMAEAFESTQGDLADRMMAALEAAQAAGGDIRGKQSAAMLVVAAEPTGMQWKDQLVDIRVDDSPEPLVELRRLLNITRAYDKMNLGDELMAKEDFDGAAKAYEEAAALAPGNAEIQYWHAVTLASVGQVEASLPIFKEVFAQDKSWKELTPRLVKPGLLPDDEALLEKIMKQ